MTNGKEKRYNGFMNLKMSPDEFSSLLEEKRKISDAEAALFAKSVGDNQAIKNPQTRQIALYSYSVSLFYSTRFDEAEKIIKSFIFTYMVRFLFKSPAIWIITLTIFSRSVFASVLIPRIAFIPPLFPS